MASVRNIEGIAHIAPIGALLVGESRSSFNMCLTHLVEIWGDRYYETYAKSEKPTILDNSFFELSESVSIARLFKAAELVKADCVILPDGEIKERDLAEALERGYEVMGVPTNLDEAVKMYKDERISKVGISSIHASKVKNAYKIFHPYNRPMFINSLIKASGEGEKFNYHRLHLLGACDYALTEWEMLSGDSLEVLPLSWDTKLAAAAVHLGGRTHLLNAERTENLDLAEAEFSTKQLIAFSEMTDFLNKFRKSYLKFYGISV